MDRALKLCLARSLLTGSVVVLLFYVETTYVYPGSTGDSTGFMFILFFMGCCIGLVFEAFRAPDLQGVVGQFEF